MLPPPFQNALILTGPTGCGKTALGVELAERLGAEIVCMDSMTLYRGMNVGTAKPTAIERQRVPHHVIDVLDPWESASVAWWLGQAKQCVGAVEQCGRRALLVGGTPLYLKALLRGLFHGPPANEAIRERLTAEAAAGGTRVLHDRLATVDALSAARLHPNDLRRLIRALEVWELTGRPISAWQQEWAAPPIIPRDDGIPRVLWIDVPRSELYARIDARVRQMIAAGWVEEARALLKLSKPLSREAAQALGYRELFAHLRGETSLEEAIECIQTRTRQFAKRQLTWFRNLPECRPATRQLTFGAWGLTM
jgi:tRNA dimethylallyltransferase